MSMQLFFSESKRRKFHSKGSSVVCEFLRHFQNGLSFHHLLDNAVNYSKNVENLSRILEPFLHTLFDFYIDGEQQKCLFWSNYMVCLSSITNQQPPAISSRKRCQTLSCGLIYTTVHNSTQLHMQLLRNNHISRLLFSGTSNGQNCVIHYLFACTYPLGNNWAMRIAINGHLTSTM